VQIDRVPPKKSSYPKVKRNNKPSLHLGPALRLVWESAPGWTMTSTLLVVVQGMLPLASLYLMKLMVDAVAAGLTTPGPDKGIAFEQVAIYIALMGAVALATAGIASVAKLASEGQSLAVTDHISAILHKKSVAVDLAYYESARYHDTLHRAQREGALRPLRLVNSLAQLGQNGLSLTVMAGLLLSLHWGVAAVLLIAAIPDALVRLRYAGKLFRWQRQTTSTERQAHYYDRMLTGNTHAQEVRLFNLGPLFIRRFRDLRRHLRRERLGLTTRRSMAEFGAQTLTTLMVFGSYGFIAYRTVQGNITVGDFVMYFQAFQRGQGHLRNMLSSLADLYEDNLFLRNLYEFLDLEPQVTEPAQPQPVPRPMQAGIVFNRLSFQYPSGTCQVLKDISLTIRPGEIVALVGENGSGKTTLSKLLCRLYDPTEGAITLDGTDLRRFETATLRRQISVIFQDYARYHLTARENIWLGNTHLVPNDERIVAAAQESGADEVVRGLPRGYETTLGKQFSDGAELSIGEWQRIALARAFLRDSQIIVLDEPTSALDARTEYEVFQGFRQLAGGRTAILISHRFSTVKMADRICVLNDGRIVENGSHDELIGRGGTYARLFEIQAQSYR